MRNLYLKREMVLVDGFPGCKLSKRDSFMFGFVLKFGFKLHFKCISDLFRGKDGHFYQVGYMCIQISNTMFGNDFQLLCHKRGYRFHLIDDYPW